MGLTLEGYVVHVQEHKVCRLVKSLYDLKQSPKHSNEKFNSILLKNGYTISNVDNYLYYKFSHSSDVLICLCG